MAQQGGRTVVVEEAPPARTPRSLAWALRIVDAGPRITGRAALASLAATSIAGLAVTRYVRPAGPLNGAQQVLMLIGLSGLALAGVLALMAAVVPARRRALILDRLVGPQHRAAIWLALAVWFPFLLIAAYYRVEATLPPGQVWIAFGYMDKRWISALYLLGALAPMLALMLAARVLEAGRTHPANWRSWLRELAPGGRAANTAPRLGAAEAAEPAAGPPWVRFIRVAAGILTALGLAYYFYGPPWYLNRTFGALPIGSQEDLYLGNFQAISSGAIPYIGPAANQYGPGAQLFSYLYMRHLGPFSVVGFRESWAAMAWIGASLLFVVFFLALGYVRGLIACLVSALIYPALQLMSFVPAGAYSGFYGWANPLRYAGAISLLLLLPAAIRRAPAWRGLACAAVLGLLWGVLSYVAQENLLAGVLGALVLGALLLLSGSASSRAVITSWLAVLAGFIVSWLPVLAFYASKGLVTRFLYLYFLDPRAVAEGYSNSPYGGLNPHPVQVAVSAPWAHMYYTLPFVLAVLALLAIVRFRPFGIAMEWSKDRIVVVAVLLTTIIMYQGALLRSDADHLTGTLLVVPALVVTCATALPRLLGGLRRTTLVLAGAFICLASLLLLPVRAYVLSSIGSQAAAPWLDRQRLATMPAPAPPDSLAALRVGTGLWAGTACCGRLNEPMSDLIQLGNELHAIIGNRTTYVVGIPAGYPGLIYFIAELRPAPYPLDQPTMVLTAAQAEAFESNFRSAVLPHTQALVSRDLEVPEVTAFRARYPHAVAIRLRFRRHLGFWALLSSPPAPHAE